ncbi:MAG: tetratricopeptide repeat protein [Gammaproteobacteria bacterium]
MERMIAPGISDHLRCIAILAVSSIVLTACATQQPTQSPTRVEIQQDVGFTITEEAGVETTVRTDYEEAVSLLEQGRNEEGIAILETVAETTPHLSAPRIDLGIAYRRIGNLEAAERNLLRALESNPDHPIAHNELGIVYRETGRFRQARASYITTSWEYQQYAPQLRGRPRRLSRFSLCAPQPGDSLRPLSCGSRLRTGELPGIYEHGAER